MLYLLASKFGPIRSLREHKGPVEYEHQPRLCFTLRSFCCAQLFETLINDCVLWLFYCFLTVWSDYKTVLQGSLFGVKVLFYPPQHLSSCLKFPHSRCQYRRLFLHLLFSLSLNRSSVPKLHTVEKHTRTHTYGQVSSPRVAPCREKPPQPAAFQIYLLFPFNNLLSDVQPEIREDFQGSITLTLLCI